MLGACQKGFVPLVAIVFIGIISTSGATIYVSQKTIPGDTLYSVKEIVEKVRIATAENKAQLYIELANEKNRELEVLQEKKASEDKVAKVIKKLQQYNQKAAELLGQAHDKGQDISKEVENLRENTKKQKQTLEKVIEKAGDEVKQAVEQTIEKTERAVENVVQQQSPSAPSTASSISPTPAPTTTTTSSPGPSPSTLATATPKPTLSPTTNPTPSPAPTTTPTASPAPTPSSKPDLVITGMNTASSMKAGNWNYFQVTIKNQGTEKYFYSSNIELEIRGSDDSTGCSSGLGSINPGESSTYELQCIAYKSGSHTATAKVDANNRIDESNESNNSYSMNFYVSP